MAGLPAEVVEGQLRELARWARNAQTCLEKYFEWGEKVRADIVRLEQKIGLPKGDPGSPPPPPPVPDLLQSLADLGTKPTPPPATSKK